MAYNCYSAKFRAALEDYKAKRITRAELDQRYAEIKSGLAERPPFWAARSARPTSAKPNTGRC